jgi:hypothetical protein
MESQAVYVSQAEVFADLTARVIAGPHREFDAQRRRQRSTGGGGSRTNHYVDTRKLLILGAATKAKNAPLPDPWYVYCTKMSFALESNRHHMAATVSHRFSGMDGKSTWLPRYRKSRPSISSVNRLALD